MRDADALLALRPEVATQPGALPAEAFQNDTLRPILKLQHEVLVAAWHRYAQRNKGTFYRLDRPAQRDFVRRTLQTNRELRSFLLGLVCGLMTEREWVAFRQNERELARRVYAMAAERLLDAPGTFHAPEAPQPDA